jgi:hypothetical protein
MQMEDAAHRRDRLAGHVGVPVFAGDDFRILVTVNPDDFWMIRHGVEGSVRLQLAKAAAEPLERLEIDRLIAEEDDLMFHERFMDFVKLPIAERLGQVDAADLSADERGEG